jgi:hypothetical protein
MSSSCMSMYILTLLSRLISALADKRYFTVMIYLPKARKHWKRINDPEHFYDSPSKKHQNSNKLRDLEENSAIIVNYRISSSIYILAAKF